jgi:uncharacterized membrane protein
MADRTDNPRIIAYAQRLVTLTDWIFTAGGGAFLVVGAYGMAFVAGLDLQGTTWLVWGQALLAISGLIWVFILIPTQLHRLDKHESSTAEAQSQTVTGATTGAG